MPVRSHSKFSLIFTIALLAFASVAIAQERAAGPVATVHVDAGQITFEPHGKGWVTVRVTGPGEYAFTAEFPPGQLPIFRAIDPDGNPLPDGTYNYEIDEKLANGKIRSDADSQGQPEKSLGKPKLFETQFGVFTVVNGSIVDPTLEENGSAAKTSGNVSVAATDPAREITPQDVVYNDDVIVTGSLCVGFDCVNGESFGFDTIRMKENNTRIKFEDTSSSAGFPTTDWQLTANDSASGGANKFSIEDITSATVPFTVTGGAPSNSLFVGSTGRVGFRTSTPILDLHASTSNTPAIRLEQTSSGGFTAQTWDIAGNEANFFIRDITGGSKLPFRIRPGAPTDSLIIEREHVEFVGDGVIFEQNPPDNTLVVTAGGTVKIAEQIEASATMIDSTGSFLGFNNPNIIAMQVAGINRLKVQPTGVQVIGTLSKSSGSFKIDHPLDPANKYLYHSFVESPDMMNIYNGNVELDEAGEAAVTMPEWFGALNEEYRYQLTPIGASSPDLHVAQGIIGNEFRIAGGTPGGQVSWQVTGVRSDPYAQANRIVVEENKPLAERGTFIFPGYYEDDAVIASAAADPVTPEAIIAEKNAELRNLELENSRLQQQLDQIMNRLTAIESMVAAGGQTRQAARETEADSAR
ncbi:MAG: hypothetical protein KY432_03120 [Acidobacteria bacterium]|nr:hypothetical protein [Acidobacteriota bacterium]